MSKIILKGRLDGTQRMRLGKLLDMLYMPSELAKAIGFTQRQVYRVYLLDGCPHVKDAKGKFWINGKLFREWYEATYPRISLTKDEAFCLSCKKPVKMIEPIKQKKGRLHYWVCKCSACGRKLARIIDRDGLNDKS